MESRTPVAITKTDLFAFVVAEAACHAAADYARAFYDRPSPEDFERIAATIAQAALASAGPLLISDATDDELLEAAEETGRSAVRAHLGAPPVERLN